MFRLGLFRPPSALLGELAGAVGWTQGISEGLGNSGTDGTVRHDNPFVRLHILLDESTAGALLSHAFPDIGNDEGFDRLVSRVRVVFHLELHKGAEL